MCIDSRERNSAPRAYRHTDALHGLNEFCISRASRVPVVYHAYSRARVYAPVRVCACVCSEACTPQASMRLRWLGACIVHPQIQIASTSRGLIFYPNRRRRRIVISLLISVSPRGESIQSGQLNFQRRSLCSSIRHSSLPMSQICEKSL